MYFCRKCKLTFEADELPSYRYWHDECERECYEDLFDDSCPECGRDLVEATECSRCECAVELDDICWDEEGEPVCQRCYYEEEDDEDRGFLPSIIKSVKERARSYGDFIFTHDRVSELA